MTMCVRILLNLTIFFESTIKSWPFIALVTVLAIIFGWKKRDKQKKKTYQYKYYFCDDFNLLRKYCSSIVI